MAPKPIDMQDLIPDGVLRYIDEEDQLHTVSVHSLAAGKKVALFAVAVALDPTCCVEAVSKFINWFEGIKSKAGYDEILCITANEPIGVKQWARTYPETKHVKFLADSSASYARALGIDQPVLSDDGLHMRSQGFTLMAENLEVYGIHGCPAEIIVPRSDRADVPPPRKKPRTEEPLSESHQLISSYGSPEALQLKAPSCGESTQRVSLSIYGFTLPADFAVALIGRDGSTIRNIRMDSGAKVTIEAPSSEEMSITMYGRTSAVHTALKMIMELFAGHPSGRDIFSFPHTCVSGVGRSLGSVI